MPLVAQKSVCAPKLIGGLSFFNLKLYNEAYLVKFSWRLLKVLSALWSRVLLSKYGNLRDAVHKPKPSFSS